MGMSRLFQQALTLEIFPHVYFWPIMLASLLFTWYSSWGLVMIAKTVFCGMCQGRLVTSIMHLLSGRFGVIAFASRYYIRTSHKLGGIVLFVT